MSRRVYTLSTVGTIENTPTYEKSSVTKNLITRSFSHNLGNVLGGHVSKFYVDSSKNERVMRFLVTEDFS